MSGYPRPGTNPAWATNTNFGAGGNPWNGQPNKAFPASGVVGEGFDPQAGMPAEWLNALINNHGSWHINHDGMLVGSGFLEQDDFTGATLADKWVTTGSTGTVTVLNDAANNAFGAVQFGCTAGQTANISSKWDYPAVAGDFYASWRVRVNQLTGTSSALQLNLSNTGSNNQIYFNASPGTFSGRWSCVMTTGGVGVNGSPVDTGVATSTSYQFLELYRTGSVLSFAINGVVTNTFTYTSTLFGFGNGGLENILTATGGGSLATITLDSEKFWADR
jgi:hypothetical protein